MTYTLESLFWVFTEKISCMIEALRSVVRSRPEDEDLSVSYQGYLGKQLIRFSK